MAAKLSAGKVGRADLLFVDPEEIIVGKNSRWQQLEEDHVESLVASFEEEGQLEPVLIRKVQGNKLQLILGFHRHAAMKRYNERHPDQPMQLQCKLVTCNEEEAFRKAVVENQVRCRTSPMDDAHAQRELRERFGWADVKIAKLFGKTPSYVSLLRKLMSLPKATQDQVHRGELSVDAACALSDLPDQEQREAVEEAAADTTSKSTLSMKVKSAVRGRKISRGEKQARTASEIRSYFANLETENTTIMSLSSLMLQFLSGSISDRQMTETMDLLF